MGLLNFIKKQFINVIEFEDFSPQVLFQKVDISDNQIQYGAQLIVRESQCAVFINEGKLADIFYPGTYSLETKNLPLLTNIKNWDKLFNSPFKSDIYFVNMKQFMSNNWGTNQPLTIRDKELGNIRLRAFGKYSFKVKEPGKFVKEVVGVSSICNLSEVESQLKSLIITTLPKIIAGSGNSYLDLAANQDSLSLSMVNDLDSKFFDLGLELLSINIESLSLPEEVQNAIDKSSSIKAIGDLSKVTSYEISKGISNGSMSGDSLVGLGAAMGLGNLVSKQFAESLSETNMENTESKLERIKELFNKGLIDEEEYKKLKEKIIGEL